MAKIPPKSPTITPNWSDFSHQKLPLMEYYLVTNTATATTTTTDNSHNPSWVDEFLNFSSTKRGNHRRSASDSVAFLEMPLEELSCRRSSTIPGSGNTSSDFDRFDDEQLMSMFTDDIPGPTLSCSNPSSPSDHNSFNEEKMKQQLKNEPDQEVQSSCDNEGQIAQPTTNENNSNEKIFDPKRIKRILANRQSAQRSRVRKLHYVSELERSVTSLQAEVSVLSPRVAFFDHQRMVLTVDNGVLKQRIAALAQDKIFKDAHQEALKREIERLRQIYYQQNLKKMENDSPPESKLQSSAMDTNGPGDKEQLVN